MNPCLLLTHNCLDLTKKCIASLRAQDIPTKIIVIDNGSTDGTVAWLDSQEDIVTFLNEDNQGVSKGWNDGLDYIFFAMKAKYALVVNNDTILPPWFYLSLLSRDVSFVTGVSVGEMEAIQAPEPPKRLAKSPDLSAFLIRGEAWRRIGSFDERMKHYASDLDYHIRAHRVGVELWNAGVHFYHERSSTLKLASAEDRREIEQQADADRAVFKSKYGVSPGDEGYAELFRLPVSTT